VGIIRVLLAAAVIFGHAPMWSGYDPQVAIVRPLPGYFAVQAFFVMSGFYMELLRKKYAPAPIWIFYSNRYCRLIVSYWIVLVVTVLLIMLTPGVSFPPATYLANLKSDSASEWALVVFSNLAIFAQDLLSLLFFHDANIFLIPQAWALALELWFYLLVPLLWRASDRTLWIIVVASLALRLIIVSSPLPFFPWQQRFFPTEMMFFVLGMLSFRQSNNILNIVKSGHACLLLVSAWILFAGWLRPIAFPWPETTAMWYSSLLVGAIFYLTLPAMFSLTGRSHIDRLIGEFSYPIYLLHIMLWYFIEPRFLLLVCIAASAPLVLFVELPLERWRDNRLRARTTESDLRSAVA
jgi:peptidoglycan/LPS O-acetylase OafA/YrhL